MVFKKLRLPTILFVLTVLLCTVAEILLLEVKYGLFFGGFLQSNQLVGSLER